MQTRKYITILAMTSLVVSSCKKDFLELYPEGAINLTTFYKTDRDFQQAVVGAYVPLRDAANAAFYLEEMRSDNTDYYYNAQDRGGTAYEQIADFMDDKGNGVISTVWKADYQGIQRCNVILDRLETAKEVTDAVKTQAIGETKALRAHYYFELVRLFGKLPLFLHEVKQQSESQLGRSSVDSVYDQIISDLTDAISKLPVTTFSTTDVQTGRITKGMAATELGMVYVTRKEWQKASDILTTVTTMGYHLLPEYKTLFKVTTENSRESIFEVQYKSGTDGQSSMFIYYFTPVVKSTTPYLGINYANTAGGWNTPTDDMLSQYEPGDKRLDASIGYVKGHYDTTGTYVADSVSSVLSPATPNEESRIFVRKYLDPPYYNALRNTDQNWPVYRYADVELLLAEALNEQGKSGDALPYLNDVRTRAGLVASTETDQALLREVIAHERRVELAFENKRWFDLIRTGQAIPVMTAFGIKQKQKYSYIAPGAYNVNANKLVYAIPNYEMTYNTALTQNDGY
ncbi:MAG TPA: RagB/SusD family nutrient uptake outer membrane protein [Puia sp.]|nr:RagB/SusD family nutrient uptake outer membrane protein [Puia sp.]